MRAPHRLILVNPTFDHYYRQLGKATIGLLLGTLCSLGLTVLLALLGLPDAAISFRGVTASLAYAFAALLAAFLVASIVASLVRWLDRRHSTGETGQA